jgi:DNA helicase-2/ATP-dependent DNA helicase PcrA
MSAVDAIFESLNPAQRRAVACGLGTENGIAQRLLIAAGAGTGKTKTLAHRVARLILGGVDPHRLLLLTFTRRAAREMTGRAQQILAASQGGRDNRRRSRTTALVWHLSFDRQLGCCASMPLRSR